MATPDMKEEFTECVVKLLFNFLRQVAVEMSKDFAFFVAEASNLTKLRATVRKTGQPRRKDNFYKTCVN